ncbi:MAG: CocE/NonD family hydrolase [Cytophagaceae bacterium]|nr:CocE/NonD family hydrolase [Gemmatimonadaceae bacterium]
MLVTSRWISLLPLCVLAAPVLAQRPAPDQAAVASVRAAYQKRELYLTMRDGTQLFTSIYVPRDTAKAYPVLLMRTPYSIAPYGADAYPAQLGPWSVFQEDGYIFVNQDVRGRYMSQGYHQFMTPHLATKRGPKDVDESTDTWDTIDWVIKNVARHNGRVGTWGNSAPGFFVASGMIDAHPAHKAAYPSAPMIDWWLGDDRHHNGAFTQAQTINFLASFDQPRSGPTQQYPARPNAGTQDGYAFHLRQGPLAGYSNGFYEGKVAFFDSIVAHPDYDEFWQRRAIWRHMKNISPSVMVVGGWYDAEDRFGPIRLYRSLREQSTTTPTTFVMGPWSHGAWNRVDGDVFAAFGFGTKTGTFFRDSIGYPFFACTLRDKCERRPPAVAMFATGSNRWHTYEAWPPREAQARTLYLSDNGTLGWAKAAKAGRDSWVSDPAKPVPYTQSLSFGYFRDYPTEDQRFATRRPDVLTFQTEPLTEDVTIAGPIEVKLHVAASGTDADFVVKVIDVYPDDSPPQHAAGPRMDGYQQLVHGNIMRARWRTGFDRSVPLTANRPDSLAFALEDVMHTFIKGHRLMVHVQGSWFPLVDRNPQTFVPNIYRAKASDFQKATLTVLHGPNQQSGITVRVLPTTVP